jgi:hypothetical protein
MFLRGNSSMSLLVHWSTTQHTVCSKHRADYDQFHDSAYRIVFIRYIGPIIESSTVNLSRLRSLTRVMYYGLTTERVHTSRKIRDIILNILLLLGEILTYRQSEILVLSFIYSDTAPLKLLATVIGGVNVHQFKYARSSKSSPWTLDFHLLDYSQLRRGLFDTFTDLSGRIEIRNVL